MIFYRHNDVEVIITGQHKSEEATYKGNIKLEESRGGVSMEWFPEEEIKQLSKSPDSEICDWEQVSSSPTVGYSNSSGGMVEIKAAIQRRLTTNVLITDIASYRQIECPKFNQLTFFMKDGTTLPTFHFPQKDSQCLVAALRKFLTFKKSIRDDSLYVAVDPKAALQKSFTELQLYDEKGDIVTKFFNDPYTVTLSGFSKVTNVFRDYLFYGKMPLACTDEEMAEFLNESLPPLPPTPQISINQQEEDTGFEVITCLELPPRPTIIRRQPLTMEEWNLHLKSDGSLKKVHKLKEKIFKGGVDPALRPEVWKFLLGFYDFKSSLSSREQHRKQRIDDYYRMKLQWKSFSKEQEDHFVALRDRKSLIEKDVGRTDRNHSFFAGEGNQHLVLLNDILMTYCMYNFDLGYVQGMSDLLSPLLVVNQNEPDVFWCFVGFIDRVGQNFEMSQNRMKTQLEQMRILIHHWDPPFSDYIESNESGNLYFFFRWLLIIFKREFQFEDVMRLWEVLWTDLPCKNFHLLVCLAILDPEKDTIVENHFGLTEILKHINDMSFHIDLEETLCRAEGLYRQFEGCKNLPAEIADILGFGLQPEGIKKRPSPSPQIKPTPIAEATSTANLVNEVETEPKLELDDIDSSMIEVQPEELDAKYQIPFSLFT